MPVRRRPCRSSRIEDVRPWAKSIKARVQNREMPPWHLDKTVGIREYKNDSSLSDEEIATISRWVDAGALQGDPKDMPSPLTFRPESDWFIGEPDLNVTFDKEMTMYANGPDWWINKFADTRLTEDRWIKAMEIKPGNPKIVHHAVTSVDSSRRHRPGRFRIRRRRIRGVRRRKIRRHLPAKHRPPAAGRIAHSIRHALLRDRRRSTRIDDDRHHVLSEGRMSRNTRSRWSASGTCRTTSSKCRRTRWSGTTATSVCRRPARIVSFQPHMHMRGKRHDARGASIRTTRSPSSARSITSTSTGTSPTSTRTMWRRSCRLGPCSTSSGSTTTPRRIAAIRIPRCGSVIGERSVDDMLQLWLDVVYLDDAEYQAQVAERKAKAQPVLTGGNQ